MARFSGERTRGVSPFKAGILAIVVLALLAYFGFSKANPFAHPFELKAVVDDARNLQTRSPVRIAGVEVGKVTKVEPVGESTSAAEVTMELREDALPLREDAELKVRPRLFLEGNYFVDLKPGTPSAPELEDGDTVPRDQTSASVSFTEVLGLLQSDVRTDRDERPAPRARERPARDGEVEVGHGVHESDERDLVLADGGRELAQDPRDLVALGALRLTEPVRVLDDGERLDEERLARAGAVVDDAGHAPAGGRSEREYGPARARGDEVVL